MTRLRRALALSVACFAGACGLFPSLSDLDSADASALDASTDQSSDVGAIDGGADSNVDADAAVSDARYCASFDGALFCEDFDEPDAIALSSLGAVVVTSGGAVTLSSARAASTPRSLLATSPTIDGGSSVQAALYVDVHITSFASTTLSFDAFLTTPIESTFVFGEIFTNAGSVISLIVDSNSTAYMQEGTYSSDPTFVNHTGVAIDWTASSWHHVVMELESGTTPHSSLTIDGTVVETHVALDSRFAISGELSVGLGMNFVGGPATARLAYVDNVVVTYTP